MNAFRAITVAIVLSMVTLTQAHALNTRTWISGTGVDQALCGPIANPCRTLQYAHDSTSPGGEIDVKDSAGYGSVVISKAITIVGDGSLAGILPPTTDGPAIIRTAITINAGSTDRISLRGLVIDGGESGGYGVLLNSGLQLIVENCVILNFTQGIYLTPSDQLIASVTNSSIIRNGNGIVLIPRESNQTARLVVYNVTAINYDAALTGDGRSRLQGTTAIDVANSNLSQNAFGVYAISASVNVDSVQANQNGTGFAFYSGAKGTISRSRASNNYLYGVLIDASASTVASAGDNLIFGSGITDVYGSLGSISPR